VSRAFTGFGAEPFQRSTAGPDAAVVSFPWRTAPQEPRDLPLESARRSHLPSRAVDGPSVTSAQALRAADGLGPQVLIGHFGSPELPTTHTTTRRAPVTA
jgi:hypothetical protein